MSLLSKYFPLVILFYSFAAIAIDWAPGHYASITTKEGITLNAHIISIHNGMANMEWTEQGTTKTGRFPRNALDAPDVKPLRLTSAPNRHDGQNAFALNFEDQVIYLDRLGRTRDNSKSIVPLEALPIPPWSVGQVVAIPNSDSKAGTGSKVNARVLVINKKQATVSRYHDGKEITEVLSLNELSDPFVSKAVSRDLTDSKPKAHYFLKMEDGKEPIPLDQYGRDIQGFPVVAEIKVEEPRPILNNSPATCTPGSKTESLPLSTSAGQLASDISALNLAPLPVLTADALTLEILEAQARHFPTTIELLKNPVYRPERKLIKDGITFYISKPVVVHNTATRETRTFAMMYSKTPDGNTYPRILYKSNSDGGWRSPPAIDKQTSHLWKGNEYLWETTPLEEQNEHYTQETKTVSEITHLLIEMENTAPANTITVSKPEAPESIFDYSRLKSERIFTYDDAVKYFTDTQGLLFRFQKYKPGLSRRELTQVEKEKRKLDQKYLPETRLNTTINLLKYYSEMVTPEMIGPGKFIPNFSGLPTREYQTNHTLLSNRTDLDIHIRVYEGTLDGKAVEWHMANDPKGRIWIDRICFKDSKLNSYGTLNTVIDSGALTNKPMEYTDQIPADNRAYVHYFNRDYSDMSPLLDQMRPIIDYRKRWGIIKQ